jgi:TRAP-type C4-dicarboxylate transport system permease small subunit
MVIHLLEKINEYIGKIEYLVALLLMGFTTLITVAQVVTRYGFNHPLTWPEELSTLLLVWITFVGASLLLKREQHIEIDFFTNYFSQKAQKIIRLINYSLMLAFMVVVTYGAYKLQAFQSRHYTVALRIPKNLFSLSLLVTGISMCLFLVLAFFRRLKKPSELPEEKKGETEWL